MCNATSNFSKSREWGMGGGYDITNRGKDEEITHSTHISRSMGEGIREEWNIYLSIRFLGRGGENVQVLRTFSPIIGNKMFQFSWNIYVPYQKRTYFWESRMFRNKWRSWKNPTGNYTILAFWKKWEMKNWKGNLKRQMTTLLVTLSTSMFT